MITINPTDVTTSNALAMTSGWRFYIYHYGPHWQIQKRDKRGRFQKKHWRKVRHKQQPSGGDTQP